MTSNWTHKDLAAWQRALELAEETYRVTREFPSEERYGLVSQMRRAAVSILSNIAEGAARRSRAEFMQFLYIARGSLAELEAQTILASRLEMSPKLIKLEKEILRVGQLLSGLIAKLRSG
ncbi:MAG TPA: four helix bundle protein [Steroidobacteraceae bacterium]|nr:four helix bundle protein [Steroidobacteraceae bacterium]